MQAKILELLQYVQTLRFYEDKLAHLQGDRFNIFDLLGAGSREVSTHTPYLAEFLNPKGVHGLGERPLAAFVRRFKLDLDPATTSVAREYYLDPKTDDKGGRVDILLTDKKSDHQVAIENKINADDQENQLCRYHNSLPRAQLVYITLNGREPSDFTTGGMTVVEQESIHRLSYEQDIIHWQEECLSQAASVPLVRETITQYINLIKRLTNQSTNIRMSTQIVDAVLKDRDNLAAYDELMGAGNAVHERIISILHEQCGKIAEELRLEYSYDNLADKDGWFAFSDAGMQEQNIHIEFLFETGNYCNLCFGICHDDPAKCDIAHRDAIAKEFNEVFHGGKPEDWWPAWSYWNGRRDWKNDGTFADIAFGPFQNELKDKVKKLLAIVRAAQAHVK
jgi:hypothetical protein